MWNIRMCQVQQTRSLPFSSLYFCRDHSLPRLHMGLGITWSYTSFKIKNVTHPPLTSLLSFSLICSIVLLTLWSLKFIDNSILSVSIGIYLLECPSLPQLDSRVNKFNNCAQYLSVFSLDLPAPSPGLPPSLHSGSWVLLETNPNMQDLLCYCSAQKPPVASHLILIKSQILSML